MYKSQHRNLDMENQGSIYPPKPQNYSTIETKDNELAEMSETYC
jgi:hypothetical protein